MGPETSIVEGATITTIYGERLLQITSEGTLDHCNVSGLRDVVTCAD